jgi:hypothetical protein
MPREVVKVTMTTTGDAALMWFPPVGIPDWATYIGVSIPDLPVNSVVQAHISPSLIRGTDLTDANLVNYWSFHPFGSATYVDLVGGAVLAKVGAPTKSESPIDGHGVALSGTAQYLQAAALGTGNIVTGDFSVMMKFKLAATVSAVTLAAKRLGAAGDGVGWECGLTADGYATITLEDAGSTTTYTSGTAVLDDAHIFTVHHTVDRDSATGYLTYIDGALDGTNADCSAEALTISSIASAYLRLGANSHGTPAALLTGTIYDFAMWSDVRTAAEVKADFLGGYHPIASAAGTVLPVCASASDPIYMDLTAFAIAARGNAIALKCATAQTGGPHIATWYFS